MVDDVQARVKWSLPTHGSCDEGPYFAQTKKEGHIFIGTDLLPSLHLIVLWLFLRVGFCGDW